MFKKDGREICLGYTIDYLPMPYPDNYYRALEPFEEMLDEFDTKNAITEDTITE
jgi:hypothetical protein